MILIKQIEISYLRSLYRAKVEDVGDLNLVFGRNDSGKSNLLRALNLFFNGTSDNDTEPLFKIDFSDIRRTEAQKGQSRQFFAIRVDFNVPSNYRKSLGTVVSVKRQWNISEEMTETLPRNMSKGARIQLTKFLNSIDFTYVPAIKDIDVFADLIQRMYDATAEGRGLQAATRNFVGAIRNETSELSSGLTKMLGAAAQLAAPAEMGLLFRSLDFSHGENEHSLLLQKGDGVKARHIPELLRYINSKESGKRLFIWGFEEPENSLDFASAEAETQNFASLASRSDTQIFITSHSPAFYLASPEAAKQCIRRYFISRQYSDEAMAITPKNAVSKIDNVDEAEEKMREASLTQLPYLIKKWSELKEDNKRLSEMRQAVEQQLANTQVAKLYVEGAYDRALFTASIKRLNAGFDVEVRALDGSPADMAELIKRIIAADGAISKAPSLFLFDNDKAGRGAFSNLSKDKLPGVMPTNIAGAISAWALPCSAEVLDFSQRYGVRPDQQFFTAEFLFPGEAAAQLCAELMSTEQIEESKHKIHESYHRGLGQLIAYPLRAAAPGSVDWFWSRGVPDNLKERYFKRAQRNLSTEYLDKVVRTAIGNLQPIVAEAK